MRKTVFGVFEQVQHKPGCTATEDGQKLEIPDLESRGIVLSVRWWSGAVVRASDFGPRGPWFEPRLVHISLWP